jgi:hypothetical protein
VTFPLLTSQELLLLNAFSEAICIMPDMKAQNFFWDNKVFHFTRYFSNKVLPVAGGEWCSSATSY